MNNPPIRALIRSVWVLTLLTIMFASVVVGCDSSPPNRYDELSGFQLERATGVLSEIQDEMRRNDARHIWIEGPSQLVLPKTPGRDEPSRDEQFEFYVYGDPSRLPGQAGGKRHESLYEAWKAGDFQLEVLGVPARIDQVSYLNEDPKNTNRSRGSIRIVINSRDLDRPFTIIAWDQERFQQSEIDRVNEIRALRSELGEGAALNAALSTARGKAVARMLEATLSRPNPWGEIRDISVLNGDLFTRVDLLSYTEAQDAFGSEFAKYFFVGRVYLRNASDNKKLVVNTTSLRANCVFYREPDYKKAKAFIENDARYKNLLAYTDVLLDSKPLDEFNQETIRRVILDLSTKSFNADDGPDSVSGIILNRVPDLRDLSDQARNKAIEAIWSDARNISEELKRIQFEAGTRIPGTERFESGRKASLETALNSYLSLQPDAIDRNELERLLSSLGIADASAISRDVADQFESVKQRATTTAEKLAPTIQAPFSRSANPVVGPTGKPLAFSPDLFRQGEMLQTGVLFQDYYRPMTFQAVLVSLIQKSESAPMRRALDTLDSLGTIAGALVGIGSISGTFAKDVFAESVALSTGVVLPEARKLLLDDLNQHITNLGTLGLDTVVEIEPNGSVDGYVFFPRGPIFGFGVDDFNPDAPSFIVNIDNVNVAVDGLLIDSSQTIAGGQKDAAISAARGRLAEQEREYDRRLLDTSSRIRTFRLATLQDEVSRVLKPNAEGVISPGQFAAAKSIITQFETTYGQQDPSGTLARINAHILRLSSEQSQSPIATPAGIEIGVIENGEFASPPAVILRRDSSSGVVRYIGAYQLHLPNLISGNGEAVVMIAPQRDVAGGPSLRFRLGLTEIREDVDGTSDSFLPRINAMFANTPSSDVFNNWSTPYIIEIEASEPQDGVDMPSIRHEVEPDGLNISGDLDFLVQLDRENAFLPESELVLNSSSLLRVQLNSLNEFTTNTLNNIGLLENSKKAIPNVLNLLEGAPSNLDELAVKIRTDLKDLREIQTDGMKLSDDVMAELRHVNASEWPLAFATLIKQLDALNVSKDERTADRDGRRDTDTQLVRDVYQRVVTRVADELPDVQSEDIPVDKLASDVRASLEIHDVSIKGQQSKLINLVSEHDAMLAELNNTISSVRSEALELLINRLDNELFVDSEISGVSEASDLAPVKLPTALFSLGADVLVDIKHLIVKANINGELKEVQISGIVDSDYLVWSLENDTIKAWMSGEDRPDHLELSLKIPDGSILPTVNASEEYKITRVIKIVYEQ